MFTAFARLARWRGRCLLIAMLALGATGASAAPAFAVSPPKWEIKMAHANPYGAQAKECLPTKGPEPAVPCGINPFTEEAGDEGAGGEGKTFARESGFNIYEITIKNTGGEETGVSNVGETLNCIAGAPSGAARAYQWLRNGVAITGTADATEKEYKLVSADEGKTIQCEVTASDAVGATVAVTSGSLVKTEPSTLPPVGSEVTTSVEAVQPIGTEVTCESGAWTGSPTFAYQWLRNGVAITGATGEAYKLVSDDAGKAIQCQVAATNAGGSSVAVSTSSMILKKGVDTGGVVVADGGATPRLPEANAMVPLVTVVDQLPAGMVLAGSTAIFEEDLWKGLGWQCAILPGLAGAHGGAGEIECFTATPLEKEASYPPITLHVHVRSQAANPSTNVATVSGGGAGSANTGEEGKTTVTEAVPFGIASFKTEVLDSLKAPFNLAGSHPFNVFSEIVLKYTTSDITGFLIPAGGPAKEVQVELPPGFVGNPQNGRQCLRPNDLPGCEANTAVGYTELDLGGNQNSATQSRIFQGKASIFGPGLGEPGISSLISNLAPPPGEPAAFGFLVASGVNYALETKLRSDGDYGVTVGDSAAGGAPLAFRTTFCAYGASGTTPNFSCNAEPASPTPASPKPFLRNLTECSSSPPTWTVSVNPWDEQKDFQSNSASVNLNETVSGCSSLLFEPDVEFEPSPPSEGGTHQADEPTGMTFNLKAPQTNEAGVNATPDLKNLKMTLPAGMTVSPSSAHGLQACSKAEFGLGTEFGLPPGVKPPEPAKPASCPEASQIGTVEVFTPLLSGAPTISGENALTCTEGTWSGNPKPSLSYQWLREGKKIETPGATGTVFPGEYAKVAADEHKALQCQVTATNAGGSSVAVSRDDDPAGPGTPSPPLSIAAPSGTASAGNPLKCAAGAWTSSTPQEFEYQWLRNHVVVSTSGFSTSAEASYTLTSADEGKVIQCQVTDKNAGGEVIADSAAVVASPVPSPPPPLPGAALQGQLFVGQPECSPCTNTDAEDGKLFPLFIQLQDPIAGVIVKLHGQTRVTNTQTGQLESVFENQPQQPFERLTLKLKGGPTAPLANPQTCGTATTTAHITPWSAESETLRESSFNVEGCPGALPFSPSFNAGTAATGAGAASSTLSVTFGREDREQYLSSVQVRMPPGLAGKIPAVSRLCGEAEAIADEHETGSCPAESAIGTAISYAGAGEDPFPETGTVYLTGPYNGAPFGLVIDTPAVAGPFNLGHVVVRSAISVDPYTAAVTVTSNPIPLIRSGVPIRLRKVNVEVTKPGFMINPTNCSEQHISATLSSAQGASAQVSSPFGVGGCQSLPFKPTFTASTQAHTSKTEGASLDVKVTYPQGSYANIAKTVTELPTALPSRLTTLQKACVDAVFEANPAACPEGSVVGNATAHTPVLNQPLVGPAYLVSHGGAGFPDLELVLQGEGVKVILDGQTDIKKGITKTTFNALPDSPISTFELNLPEGPHSVLGANVAPCSTTLNLPTTLTGQNGAVIKQTTHIAVIGCPPTVSIVRTKLSGNALLVTVKTSAKGTVWISGYGLKTVKKNLPAGAHQIRVAFTKMGISRHKHHKKTSVRVKLTVGKQAVVAKAATVQL